MPTSRLADSDCPLSADAVVVAFGSPSESAPSCRHSNELCSSAEGGNVSVRVRPPCATKTSCTLQNSSSDLGRNLLVFCMVEYTCQGIVSVIIMVMVWY